MRVSLATCAALFALVAAASCAPAGPACAAVRVSSLEFNRVARGASVLARNGSKDVPDFSTSLAWMEAGDMCDPEGLKQKSAPCFGKMLGVLASYRGAVERVSGFQSCSESARRVEPAMQRLQEDMRACVRSRGGMETETHVPREEAQPVARWQEALLCHYTMDRLFSFSILAARVFAVGDPALHAQGSAQSCARSV